MQNKLQQYIKLEIEYKELEARKQALRLEILNEMNKEKMQKVDTDFGSFTVCTKKSWKYTPAVSALEEKLKIARIKEQDRGVAKAVESEYLLFKPVI